MHAGGAFGAVRMRLWDDAYSGCGAFRHPIAGLRLRSARAAALNLSPIAVFARLPAGHGRNNMDVVVWTVAGAMGLVALATVVNALESCFDDY